eukprot:GEMP01060776.1.p1 GENE.GEMP01060776.1~~GEMP01060776.1.p1  ORF type:complete len:259 (+),score=75.09 GEMP01060776.1:56-832(+)
MVKKGHGIIHNDYIRRKKKSAYYDKKKMLNKWGRQRKHALPEADQGEIRSMSLLDRIFSGDADVGQVEEEYERALRGGIMSSTSSSRAIDPAKRIKKKKKKIDGVNTRAGGDVKVVKETVSKDTVLGVERKKRKKQRVAAAVDCGEVVEPVMENERIDAVAGATAEEDGERKKRKKKDRGAKGNVFTKAQREYEEKFAEQQKAEEARLAEEAERAQKRLDTKKRRQVQGRLLNSKTSRGQPKMQSVLEAWLLKKGLQI